MDNIKKAIQEIFDHFSKLKVLIVGDVMIDSYLWGKVERISPEAPVPIVSVKKRENRLGGAANVALNISALGATPYMCSVIGEDIKGRQFIEILEQLGLPCEGIIKSSERITTTKFRVLGNNVQMLRVDEEVDNPLSVKDYQNLENRIFEILEKNKPDVIIFQDYDKGTLDNSLIKKIIANANSLKIPVVVDPKKQNFNAFSDVNLFKPNLKELKEGLKITDENFNFDASSSSIKEFQQTQNIDSLLLTLSEKGVYISYKMPDGTFADKHLPAYIRSIADVSGAGDTVISVAALCMALKLNPVFMAALSNLAGGLVCEKVGVVPVEKDQLMKEAVLKCVNYLPFK